MSDQPGLAIFDLDYTLTRRGTWGRFVWMNVKSRPHIWLPLIFAAGWTQFRYKRGHLPRKAVKLAMMKWAMQGRSRKHLELLAEKFAIREVQSGLRSQTPSVLSRHAQAGDHLMIASAAVDILVKPIAEKLGIAHFVATDMAWDQDDIVKMEFASENCYGPEKLNRVIDYLKENPRLKQNNTIITFYSDSYSDLDLFQFCDVSVAVNPDKRLKQQAKLHNIRVVDWDN